MPSCFSVRGLERGAGLVACPGNRGGCLPWSLRDLAEHLDAAVALDAEEKLALAQRSACRRRVPGHEPVSWFGRPSLEQMVEAQRARIAERIIPLCCPQCNAAFAGAGAA